VNRFVRHHRDSIHFGYSCFDRMLCSGTIPQFQHTARGGTIRWFLRTHRQAEPLSRAYFGKLSREYHEWVTAQAQQNGVPLVELKEDVRREEWVQPYYQQLGQQAGVAVILKCREPERIVVHFAERDHLAVEKRFVNLYYFYLNDARFGRLFLRVCPYFPFNLRVWLNGHNWLACRLREEGIAFQQRDNLFVDCADPERLQALADAFSPQDIRTTVTAWAARLLPFFSAAERQQGYVHHLFMSQIEYCHNLLFKKPGYAERLLGRLVDINRSLGHPDKLATYFGRAQFVPDTRTGQTVVKMTKFRTLVISNGYNKTSLKQYLKHPLGLRTESTCYDPKKDLGVNRNIDNLPKLRQVLHQTNERYENVQQDVLATYLDRGQLQELRQPSVSTAGRRVPGLHVDDPRLIAVLQALTCFVYLVGRGCFRTKDLLPDVRKALDNPDYQLSQLRYDLSKLRGKGLVIRVPRTQSYQLTPEGYRLAFLYLKLYHRLYAPLTAALRDPVPADNQVLSHHQTKLDRLYVAVDRALQDLTDHLGVAA
jgi:hypothetical protein